MKHALLLTLITLVLSSCYKDINDSELQGNIFDQDFTGDLIENIFWKEKAGNINRCYLDIYFYLTQDAIRSLRKVKGENKDQPGGSISIYLDGRLVMKIDANNPNSIASGRIKIRTKDYRSDELTKTLKFLLNRVSYDNEEEKSIVWHEYELPCVL